MRARVREREVIASNPNSPRSVPLPSDIRPASKGFQFVPTLDLETTLAESRLKDRGRRPQRRLNFNFWKDMPHELKVQIFLYLEPREIIRISSVSRIFYEMAFDGQLWTDLDCQSYYQQITKDALVSIILRAGSFIKNLNLRGCIQLQNQWLSLGTRMHGQECRNLESFNIEGCKIERSSIHFFLLRNPKLVHINMPGMQHVNKASMKIVAQNCPLLEFLNVDWCSGIVAKDLQKVVQSCQRLSDLRASEVRGFDDLEFMLDLFLTNNLERLILQNCESLTDEALTIMTCGIDPEIDALTDRPIVPPRKLRHLDITRCTRLTDEGVRSMAYNVPALEGLRICQNPHLTDDALDDLLISTPRLTHLEVEELDRLTNNLLLRLAKSGSAANLEHFSISYCENLGDTGMLPLLKSAPNIRSLYLDNTKISDLVLMEVADIVRKRGSHQDPAQTPKRGLTLVCFDCQNVTWAGIREVLNKNAAVWVSRDSSTTALSSSSSSEALQSGAGAETPASSGVTIPPMPLYPAEIITLKCFYGYQPTVTEHTKRVLRANWNAASRLELKWAQWQIANEEVSAAGVAGIGGRRRRRRARQARQELLDDEHTGADGTDAEEEGTGGMGGGRPRRRRARSGNCVVM